MMRGMFAAISGLKNHQMMLDVTANDIANVNTIGYKRARTTFKDSLAQMQRGGSGAGRHPGRLQPGPGRPRRAARLDRQPDGRRRAPVDRQRARHRHPGRRVLHPRPGEPPTAAPAAGVHARGQLHAQPRRLPRDAGRLLRPRLHRQPGPPATPTTTTSADHHPGDATNLAVGPGRLDQLHRRRRRQRASRPATCSWRSSPTRRPASAAPATAGSARRTPAPPQSGVAGADGFGLTNVRHGRDVERRPRRRRSRA